MATAAQFSVLWRRVSGIQSLTNSEPGLLPQVLLARVAGSAQGFGPVVEATLPADGIDTETRLLDLETGRCVTQPSLERLDGDPDAIVSWLRSNSAHVSGRIWQPGGAACITYNLTAVPVATDCWKESAAHIPNIFPAPGQHSPRRLLVLEPGRADTYVFRTDEGTLGMFRLVGVSDDGRAVKIRYKLLQARTATDRGAPERQ